MNLADYQRFLFEESEAPALVVRYRKERPTDSGHRIDYWAPKTDWAVTQAEVISILPQDRSRLTVREVLDDLQSEDAPLIWKERFWATPRDWRLLDRLSLLPRLRDIVDQPSRRQGKRWLIAEGFQPLGENDDPEKGKTLKLPSRLFVKATSPKLRLFLLEEDCDELPSRDVMVRNRSNTNTQIYQAPHVFVTKGLKRSAFADFDVVLPSCFARHPGAGGGPGITLVPRRLSPNGVGQVLSLSHLLQLGRESGRGARRGIAPPTVPTPRTGLRCQAMPQYHPRSCPGCDGGC